MFQLFALVVVEQREDQAVAGFLAKGFRPHGLQLAAEAAVGGQPGGEVQVTAAPLHQAFHQLFDLQLHGPQAYFCTYFCSVPLGVTQ